MVVPSARAHPHALHNDVGHVDFAVQVLVEVVRVPVGLENLKKNLNFFLTSFPALSMTTMKRFRAI